MSSPDPDSERQIQEAAAHWFARLRGEAVDVSERARFEAWLAADPAHRREYELFERLWQDAGHLARRGGGGRPARAVAKAAGLAIVLILCGWLAAAWFDRGDLIVAETRRHIRLADGSDLDVAPRTRLRVDVADATRHIALEEGEIAVRVAADPARPFEVSAAGARIRDIGTYFDVLSEAGRVRVAVAEGAVEITLAGDLRRRLGAGEAVELDGSAVAPAYPVDARNALAWTDGRLVFDAVPLAEVIAALNRQRRTPIELDAPELAAMRVSGVFLLDDETAAPRALAAIVPVRFVAEGGRLHARRAPR